MREKNKNKNKHWLQILSIFSYYYLPWEKKRRGGGGGGEGRKVSVCHAPVSRINVHGMCQYIIRKFPYKKTTLEAVPFPVSP
jgi:hypothetical protein